jgi:hypothetical protein
VVAVVVELPMRVPASPERMPMEASRGLAERAA